MAKKISSASVNAAICGIPKMFIPKWNWWSNPSKYSKYVLKKNQQYSDPRSWTYLYDHSQLGDTLDKYLDYNKLNLAATKEELPSVLRLLITTVDVLTAKPLIFDNTKVEIKTQHILASTGYPIYGFPWIEIDEGLYGWDGCLLSSTPIREVLFVSPQNDKNIIIVENYPKQIDRLPSNLAEVANRYKDILLSDKDLYSIKMSKLLTRHIRLIENLYDIFENFADKSNLDVSKIKSIEKEYNTLIENYGAEIRSITRIIRSEIELPTILKNDDFSLKTIKNLIEQGERKTIEKLQDIDFE